MAIHFPSFPALAATTYLITSPPERGYNCIAWAAGRTDAWWWPDTAGFEYWPAGVPRLETLNAFQQAFATLGYATCSDASFEAGWEKVALFVLDGLPTHAARQLPNGRWTSKLGPEEDIEHELNGLVGPCYGSVAAILRRPVSRSS